jgi:hypothetical protein
MRERLRWRCDVESGKGRGGRFDSDCKYFEGVSVKLIRFWVLCILDESHEDQTWRKWT